MPTRRRRPAKRSAAGRGRRRPVGHEPRSLMVGSDPACSSRFLLSLQLPVGRVLAAAGARGACSSSLSSRQQEEQQKHDTPLAARCCWWHNKRRKATIITAVMKEKPVGKCHDTWPCSAQQATLGRPSSPLFPVPPPLRSPTRQHHTDADIAQSLEQPRAVCIAQTVAYAFCSQALKPSKSSP